MGIFLLYATWAHEYIKIDGHRMSGRFKRAVGMWF